MPNPNWSSDNPYGSRQRTGFPEHARLRNDNPHSVTAVQTGAVTPPQLDAALAALKLDDLADVDTSGAANGEVLQFDGSNWIPAEVSGGGGATNLDGLTDVTITAPAVDQTLLFDGSQWRNSPGIPGPQGPQGVPGSSGVILEYVFSTATTPPPASGQVRLNNASASAATILHIHNITNAGSDVGTFIRSLDETYRITLQEKDDSTKFQRFHVAGAWADGVSYISVPVAHIEGGMPYSPGMPTVVVGFSQDVPRVLDSLDDVTITTPTTDQILKYNGTAWINAATGGGGSVAWDDVTGKPTAFPPEPHTHAQSDVTNLVSDLAAKAPLDSPALTGVPTAPTAPTDTGTSQIANCEFVNSGFAKKDETNLSGGLYLTGVSTPTILAADQNNYAPDAADPCAVWVLTSSVAVNITGLAVSTIGRILYILNNNTIGGAAITLKNQNTASTAGGRFAFAGNADAVLAPQEGITLIRVALRWHSFGK